MTKSTHFRELTWVVCFVLNRVACTNQEYSVTVRSKPFQYQRCLSFEYNGIFIEFRYFLDAACFVRTGILTFIWNLVCTSLDFGYKRINDDMVTVTDGTHFPCVCAQ